MEDWQKMLLAAAALALIVGLYCNTGSEQLKMPHHTGMPVTDMTTTMMPEQNSFLQPADTDTTDYGPFPGSSQPCVMTQPYAQ